MARTGFKSFVRLIPTVKPSTYPPKWMMVGKSWYFVCPTFMPVTGWNFQSMSTKYCRNAIDLEVFNDRLDVITSGQEFQDSILEATFDAPHYETSHADAIFLNDYGDPGSSHGLDLPPDESDDIDSRPNRSAAAVATTVQTAKPIEISGHVWIDNNLDATRQSGEVLLAGCPDRAVETK